MAGVPKTTQMVAACEPLSLGMGCLCCTEPCRRELVEIGSVSDFEGDHRCDFGSGNHEANPVGVPQ